MRAVTFVTGNQNKVKYLEQSLGYPVKHAKMDLDEIQSLDLHAIVEHKVRQAYDALKEPVLVEDGSLEFMALGRLPGPFIRFFNEEVPMETMCRILDGMDRRAVARSIFGYFDGADVQYFDGKLEGTIAEHPAGEHGWHWDKIFIPTGSSITRAHMNAEEYEKTMAELRPFEALKGFFEGIQDI